MKCNPWVGGSIGRRGFPMLGTGKRGLSTYVRELFANGEQGFFYDPNDLSTMFQDAAGTVPVTAVGQPVGLVLDKSNGMVRGTNLAQTLDNMRILDDGISSGTWDAQTRTMGNVGSTSNDTRPRFEFSFATLAGAFYEVRIKITGNLETLHSVLGLAAQPNGSYCGIVRATKGTMVIQVVTALTPTTSLSIAEFSVRQILGDHAYQTTSASRPILRRNATTGAYYLEFDGTDDFLVTNSIDFTATDKVSLFAGVRKLSDSGAFPMIAETGASAHDPGSFHLYANSSTTSRGYVFAATGATQVWRTMTTDYASPDSAVITAFANLSATGDLAVKQRRNGVNQSIGGGAGEATGGGKFGNRPLYIGRRAGGTYPFTGHIYSLIGVGRLTTDSETIALEKSIAKNTGVTL